MMSNSASVKGLLDCADPANIDPDTSVKLQRLAAGGRFWVSKHDPDLFPDLICENAAGARS